jgi:hypothetical protein
MNRNPDDPQRVPHSDGWSGDGDKFREWMRTDNTSSRTNKTTHSNVPPRRQKIRYTQGVALCG